MDWKQKEKKNILRIWEFNAIFGIKGTKKKSRVCRLRDNK